MVAIRIKKNRQNGFSFVRFTAWDLLDSESERTCQIFEKKKETKRSPTEKRRCSKSQGKRERQQFIGISISVSGIFISFDKFVLHRNEFVVFEVTPNDMLTSTKMFATDKNLHNRSIFVANVFGSAFGNADDLIVTNNNKINVSPKGFCPT